MKKSRKSSEMGQGPGSGSGSGQGQGSGSGGGQGSGSGDGQGKGLGYGGGQGRNKGGSYGTGGFCVCTKCGEKVTHSRGEKCTTIKCPKCGHTMIREEMVRNKE